MTEITPTVKHLILINVTIFAIELFQLVPFWPGFSDFFTLYPIKSEPFQPYQVVTSLFMHGNLPHLFMNMLGLYFLGPTVEKVLGTNRFLILYFSAGIASSLLQGYLSDSPAVGASGAIYGVLAAFATMFPNMKMMVFPIPFEIKAVYLVAAYMLYDLYSGVSGADTGIAHFGHLGGAIAGILIIFLWNKNSLR